MQPAPIRCAFCAATVADDNEATECGWEPYFWLDRETFCGQPVCHMCQDEHIEMVDYEPTMKAGHSRFLMVEKGD